MARTRRNPPAAALTIGLTVAGILGYAGWRLYQRHLDKTQGPLMPFYDLKGSLIGYRRFGPNAE